MKYGRNFTRLEPKNSNRLVWIFGCIIRYLFRAALHSHRALHVSLGADDRKHLEDLNQVEKVQDFATFGLLFLYITHDQLQIDLHSYGVEHALYFYDVHQ